MDSLKEALQELRVVQNFLLGLGYNHPLNCSGAERATVKAMRNLELYIAAKELPDRPEPLESV